MQNIQRPESYEKVIRNKEAAKENIKIAENERPRLLVQAKSKRAEAVTQAEITLEKAQSDAKVLKLEAQARTESITIEYEAEEKVYKKFKDTFSLATLLSYMSTNVLLESNNTVNIAIDPPAKTKYSYT